MHSTVRTPAGTTTELIAAVYHINTASLLAVIPTLCVRRADRAAATVERARELGVCQSTGTVESEGMHTVAL